MEEEGRRGKYSEMVESVLGVRRRLHQQTALIPKTLASHHEWTSFKEKWMTKKRKLCTKKERGYSTKGC